MRPNFKKLDQVFTQLVIVGMFEHGPPFTRPRKMDL